MKNLSKMNVTKTEKEWFHNLKAQPIKPEEKTAPAQEVEKKPEVKTLPRETGRGFKDVAGMSELKQLVTEGFINVLKNKECAAAYGIQPPSLLFYGPAGCGKTFFAEKVAEEAGIPFIKVVPDDIASTLVHGTQKKIGELFRKAERKAPTLMFFDEFDAMVPCRSNDDRNYQNGEVSEFLCVLNKAAERGVYVLAATNHPERIDKAVLRTGRIDEMVYVGMPDQEARESLFRLTLSKLPVDEGIDFAKLAILTNGYNCSDISYIVKTASRKMFNATLRERNRPYRKITQELLEDTILHKSPSVSSRDIREYERIRSELSPKDTSCKRPAIGFR